MKIRIGTGIPGMDLILDGGLPKNRSILLRGKAGTGKTTLAIQFLVNGILEHGENGVLLALEYDTSDFISDMDAFNWPLQDLIEQKKLAVINLPGGMENPQDLNIDDLINLIHEKVTEIGATRLIINSLNSIELIFEKNQNVRQDLSRFITLIRDLECTSIMLAEEYEDKKSQMYTYLSQGVINLYNVRVGAQKQRAIEILKMRGVNHSTLSHSMAIESGEGVIILPHEIDISNYFDK